MQYQSVDKAIVLPEQLDIVIVLDSLNMYVGYQCDKSSLHTYAYAYILA